MSTTLSQQREHGSAGIDGVGAKLGVLSEQCREKTAIAITKHERTPSVCQLRKEVEAAPLKSAAQCKVFEPSVGACDAVEV